MKWVDHCTNDRSWLRLIPAHELTTAYRVVAARQTPAPRLRPITPQVTHFGRARRSRRQLPDWTRQLVTTVVFSASYTAAWLLVFELMRGRLP